MKIIDRPEYLNWLIRWREQQIIKVVSGVRRCGKSTLFEIYRDYLLHNGVQPNQIITINFEDLCFEQLTDYHLLNEYVNKRLLPDKMNYLFLDEVQHCPNFEKAVDSLFINKNCDLYLTGSNAYFMSGDLATLLSGRYVELKMLPLSFSEFTNGLDSTRSSLSKTEKFNLYLKYGSFPYVLRYNLFGSDDSTYLNDLYNTIILKDVVQRLKIQDVNTMDQVTKFMLHNVGNRVTSAKIANTLKSSGKSADQKTIDKYLTGLTDAMLLYKVSRFNLKGRQYLTTQNKYYVVDTGIRNNLIQTSQTDLGHQLENLVFLELMRRGSKTYTGQFDNNEIDFVTEKEGNLAYYQVAASTLDETTLNRELSPLMKVTDNYPKYLLTLDEIQPNANYSGVIKMNAIDWLLNK